MPNPTAPKAKNPNIKVFIVLTPAGKEIRIRAESFSLSGDGGAINFAADNRVVATFSLANVTGVTAQRSLIRETPPTP